MPVLDGVFVPRTLLTAAEAQVDFVAHNTHIVERRQQVEKAATQATKRLAVMTVNYPHLVHLGPTIFLEARLSASLDATAAFGYQQARRELANLRNAHRVAARYSIPDAGAFSTAARNGLPAVRDLVRKRAHKTAIDVAAAASTAAHKASLIGDTAALASVTSAALRSLHNHVLEMVGETLNLGRTAGALSLANPPEFALRSEQLDRNTCDACERLHGEIAQTDSPEFYELTPPSDCYGGGRCRGIWVFGYTRSDVDLPQAA